MGSCALVKWSMCDWDAVSTDYGKDSHWGILINSVRLRKDHFVSGGKAVVVCVWRQKRKEGGDLTEYDSSRNKMRPYWWDITESVQLNVYSGTLQGSQTNFDFHFFSIHLMPQLSSVDLVQVSVYCIMWKHTAGTQLFPSVHFLRLWWPMFLRLFLSYGQAGLSIILCPSSGLLKPPLALNNTSRHAVRDQLTLKLLDFTLKAAVLEEYWVLQTVLLDYAQTLPGGTLQWGKYDLSYANL